MAAGSRIKAASASRRSMSPLQKSGRRIRARSNQSLVPAGRVLVPLLNMTGQTGGRKGNLCKMIVLRPLWERLETHPASGFSALRLLFFRLRLGRFGFGFRFFGLSLRLLFLRFLFRRPAFDDP